MKHIPIWIREALEKKRFKCVNCKASFTGDDLIGIGIRKSSRDNRKDSVFIELLCKKCKKLITFEAANMSLLDLSINVLSETEDPRENGDQNNIIPEENFKNEEEEKEDWKNYLEKDSDSWKNNMTRYNKEDDYGDSKYGPKRTRRRKYSKITLKDLKAAKQTLSEIKTHDDFLEMIGFSPEEIQQIKEKK